MSRKRILFFAAGALLICAIFSLTLPKTAVADEGA